MAQMMLSLKGLEQVQQFMFWMLHAKASDEGKIKSRSQLVAKSQRKQVSYCWLLILSCPIPHYFILKNMTF